MLYGHGGLIHAAHKVVIKCALAVGGVSLGKAIRDQLGARNDDLVAASDPQKALDKTFNKCVVLVVVTCSVGINDRLKCADVSLVAFNADHKLFAARCLCGLGEFAVHQHHRGKALVQNCFNFKLHI